MAQQGALASGARRGPGTRCLPETTLGPELSAAAWSLTRGPISGKDLPGEDGTDMKEKEEDKKRKKKVGRGGGKSLQKLLF